MIQKFKGDILLLLAAFVFGSGLVAQSEGNHLGPWSFTTARFILGAIVLFPITVFVLRHKSEEQKKEEMSLREVFPGAFATAVTVAVSVIAQQYGLIYTSVGKTGFITSLYVIGVPIAGVLFLHRKISRRIWIAAVISVVGFYFISLSGGFEALNRGDLLVLISAVTCVIYLYTIDHFSKRADPFLFTALQFFLTGVICIPGVMAFEVCTPEMIRDALIPILYAGIGVCAIGYTFQMIGQKTVPPERATILLSTESLFSLFSGMIVLGEMLSVREYIGCALIFIAVLLAETKGKGEKVTNERE